MTDRMTDEARLGAAREAVAEALDRMGADDPAKANSVLAHAVHAGVQPLELVAEVVAQTGGKLP